MRSAPSPTPARLHLLRTLRIIARDQRGTSSAEFVVLLVVIAVACLTGWYYMGQAVMKILVGE